MSLAMVAGITVFLASVILSQRIGVNAGAALDDATKLKLAEVFPRRNLAFTVLVFGMVVAFLLRYTFSRSASSSLRSHTAWLS